MKTIILVLVAMLALVGFATAWDSTDLLQSTYTKTAYIQGQSNLPVLAGAVSYAGFEADNNGLPGVTGIPWETEGSYANLLVNAGAGIPTVSGASQTQQAVLTQSGYATATIRAPDANDVLPEQSGSYGTYQDLKFLNAIYSPTSSPAGGRANSEFCWADFASEGSVGIQDTEVASTTLPESAVNIYDALPAIEGTTGTTIRSADLSVTGTTGMTNDMYNGLGYTVSGSTTASASFAGGMIPSTGGFIQSNTGMYETTVGIQQADWPAVGAEGGEFPTGYPDW